MVSEMEESQLDYAAQASSELVEFLSACPPDERDCLINAHIRKLTEDTSVTSVFDPTEKADWIFGPKGHSLSSFCAGRVALLDFFTYCCINCQHVLPDLYDLEKLYSRKDGLTVIGVHSAKFETERLSSNVLHAVQRLNIKHPVLNDPEAKLWTRLGIHCWPTLVLLSPEGKPILVLAGEGHRDILFKTVSVALAHFREIKTLKIGIDTDINLEMEEKKDPCSLKFPGKVSLNSFCNEKEGEPWLAISDTGNNRILLVDYFENVTHIIGGMDADLRDGNFEEARFNNPQGVYFLKTNVLFVCDTGNHAIRRISLDTKKVEMFAGTGVQAEFGDHGGLKYYQQALSSPWDIILYRTADMDMSIRKPIVSTEDEISGEAEIDSLRRVLLIASAGSHQIWAIFLDDTVWWKYKTYTEGTVLPIVGSGREENRNNRYPSSASLAQPSGLGLKDDTVFIADSESSSIRSLDIKSGQLSPLAGADRNPSNLFAYGDLDGRGYSARLQHPLDVACCLNSSLVYIADTYNNKIKSVDSSNGECITIYPTAESSLTLSEPGGLCMSNKTQSLIIADTNNHRIVMMNVNTKETKVLQLKFPTAAIKIEQENYTKKDLVNCTNALKILSTNEGSLILNVDCLMIKGEKDLHLTPKAPQRWLFRMLDSSLQDDVTCDWEIVGGIRDGKELPARIELLRKPGLDHNKLKQIVRIEFFLSVCEDGACFLKRFAVDTVLTPLDNIKTIHNYELLVKMSPDGEITAIVEDI